MRKLLSITSVLCFCLILGSCNRNASKNIPAGTDKEMNADGESAPRAIEHDAPDQARIDSIKAAKAKLRAIEHKAPDQEKIDSIKAAKSKLRTIEKDSGDQ